jgi:hypothetical protein
MMDAKRFVIGTLVGGIVLYATGYLIFNLAFASFYAANVGSATGVRRDPELMWAVVLGSFSYAALLTYAMGNRLGSLSVPGGLKTGAVVGFLLWCTVDLIYYGTTNVANLTSVMVDPLLEIIHGGIGGGVIAAVLARVAISDRARHQVTGFGV